VRSACFDDEPFLIEYTFVNQNEIKKTESDSYIFPSGRCHYDLFLEIDSANESSTFTLQNLDNTNFRLTIDKNAGNFLSMTLVKISQQTPIMQDQLQFYQGPILNNDQRMLHAEFFGWNDDQVQSFSMQDVARFRAQLNTGCQIYGHMFIRKVPGNFHISTHHKGIALSAIPEAIITARHRINLLEITRENGEVTQGYYLKSTNPIDGLTTIGVTVGTDVEYYMKILGSKYKHVIWGEKELYQYVAHINFTPSRRNIPKIEFKYEFDPVSMNYTNYRSSFSNFLVSLCAIVGGIVASSILVNQIMLSKQRVGDSSDY